MEQEEQPRPELIVPMAGQRGMTDLQYAAYCNDPEEVRVQLRLGVPVDAQDENGWTALHWSIDMSQAWGEPEQVVTLLLAAGASANAVDSSGFSVLMMACGRNNEAIVEQLIKSGANIGAKDTTGRTALHEAAACDFSEAISLLLSLGVDPKPIDKWNRTPEQIAEECGFEESARLLKATLPT